MNLSDLTRPPEGAALRSAVLTTFDLDLSALLALPADPGAAARYMVFYGDGRFRDCPSDDPLRDTLHCMLIPAIFPPAENGWPRAHAHGKIWLFEFADPSGERLYRLSVHSRNLYPDNNLENQVVFCGRDMEIPQPKTKPLIDYLGALRVFAGKAGPEKLLRLDTLAKALSTVRFELLPAYSAEDYDLIGPGMEHAAFLRRNYDELLIVCQRIQRGGLSQITAGGNGGARSITVSNLSSIRELLAEGPVRTRLLPQNRSGKYIHAKIYLMRSGDQWDLFCGSMNLTAFAVSRNLEFMVHLKNPAFIRSVEGFLSGFLGIPEETIRLQTGIREIPDLSDSPVFRAAASLPVRYCVLSRMLSRKKISLADADRITAYVLSPACEKDLTRLLHDEGLPSIPERRAVQFDGRQREVYLLPLRERMLLALVNQALHRYDGCFSAHLYSHIRGKEPIYALSQIREDPEFENLYLFRTDVRNFGTGLDAELLSASVRALPGIDPAFCSFADRFLSRRSYLLDGVLYTDGPAVQPGNALCSFFENVYLRDLDIQMETRAAFYARCADDILIGAGTREELEKLAEEVTQIMADRKLRLHESKTRILDPGASFSYLGWQISGSRIDFRPEELDGLRRLLRKETKRMMTECRKQRITPVIRQYMIVSYVNELTSRLGLTEAFRVVSVPDGLRKIDRMLCDMIRAVASGKTGNAKYRISYREIRKWGYHCLVNQWYRSLAGKDAAAERKKPRRHRAE